MRVAIGSDHAGFALKEAVKSFLTAERREVLDLGIHGTEPEDYADYAEAVGRALRENRAERGILFCGSGVMAFSTITGFGVTPRNPSTPIRRRSSPLVIRLRRM